MLGGWVGLLFGCVGVGFWFCGLVLGWILCGGGILFVGMICFYSWFGWILLLLEIWCCFGCVCLFGIVVVVCCFCLVIWVVVWSCLCVVVLLCLVVRCFLCCWMFCSWIFLDRFCWCGCVCFCGCRWWDCVRMRLVCCSVVWFYVFVFWFGVVCGVFVGWFICCGLLLVGVWGGGVMWWFGCCWYWFLFICFCLGVWLVGLLGCFCCLLWFVGLFVGVECFV